MISRLTKTVQTLAVVVLAYVAYAMLAAPLIEPRIELVQADWEPNSNRHLASFDAGLFPAGSWELGEPKVLETNQGTLLFDDYQQLENGDLRLPRCTLISYIDPPQHEDAAAQPERSTSEGRPPNATGTPSVTNRRPVIMRASQGAVLSFDPPPDFLLGKFGRLIGGKLQGDVTIFSPASTPGGDDELRVTTRNIQVDPARIWAPSQVEFLFGRNRARGRDLSIHLEQKQSIAAGKKAAMGKIRSLELVHVDEVSLQLEGDMFAMATGQPSGTSPASEPDRQIRAQGPTPIEIKCQGPFRFDFDALIASLEERVDVIRHNLDGPSDQLNCELLEIHLMPKDDEETPGAGANGQTVPASADPSAAPQPGPAGAATDRAEQGLRSPLESRPGGMQPSRIIAVGFPVMIRAPSLRAGARAKRIEYDFRTRRVQLSGSDNATLFSDEFFVEAPRLEYELLEGGRLGRLQAAGPGLARGHLGDKRRPFQATWAGTVSLLPQGPNKVLSLIGQANLNLSGMASLKADNLHLYLLEVPRPGTDQVDIHADRMLASGHIELDSPQLIAFLSEAQLWFREPTTAESAAASDAANQPASGLLGRQEDVDRKRPKKLQLTAGVLRGQVVLTESPQLESLDLQHDVHVNEYQPAGTSTLDIAAQRVLLQRGHTPTAELTLTGAPARFAAEGMTLDGSQIQVQLAGNVAEVIGPGSMLLLPSRVGVGTGGHPKPLNVQWTQGMHFDGRTARFTGQIETRGGHVTDKQQTTHLVARGEVLEVELNRRIEFTAPAASGVDAVRLKFVGLAHVESRTVDPTGNRVSLDSLEVRDLSINRPTGDVTGQGPGHIIHRGPNPQKKQADSADHRPAPKLVFLRVDFEHQMVGNLHTRELQFLNGTRTIMGPIATWEQTLDPLRPDLLGPRGAILTSRRLEVADMGDPSDSEDAIEINATGNAHIRGRQFAATGDRVSYIDQKGQLVLKGDGRTKSTLEFQRQEGTPWQKLSANTILFVPETRQFALDDFEVELNVQGLTSKSRAATPGAGLPGTASPAGSRPLTRPPTGDPRSNFQPPNYPPTSGGLPTYRTTGDQANPARPPSQASRIRRTPRLN